MARTREEAEAEAKEKIRLKQYVSLRSWDLDLLPQGQIIVFLNSIIQLIMCNLLLYRWLH
jgi:hypothetical protein